MRQARFDILVTVLTFATCNNTYVPMRRARVQYYEQVSDGLRQLP
jgi:hypothetical protein